MPVILWLTLLQQDLHSLTCAVQEYKDKVPQNIVDAINTEVMAVRGLGDEASAEDIKAAVSKLQARALLAWPMLPLLDGIMY